MTSRRWTRIFKSDPRAEVNDELAFHFEQRVRDYIGRGMDPEAARAATLERLGDLNAVKSECTELLTAERRAVARRNLLKFSWLDFKLGGRMLVKYPGLTLVGGLAMAFAIAVGAVAFESVNKIFHPRLPLPGGDRIVAIRNWDVSANEATSATLRDLEVWRKDLTSVQDVGAYQMYTRNLITDEGRSDAVSIAEISASAFRVARTAPLIGRPLLDADELVGAPPVLLIGEDMWQARFNGDPAVVGRVVRLGRAQVTIVGVMPESFGFPVASSLWTPLRSNPNAYGRGSLAFVDPDQSEVILFGRLAEGVTLAEAQAELSTIGQRAAQDDPTSYEFVRPRVMPYGESIFEIPIGGVMRAAFYSSNLIFILFLALICANVAALVFARTATRENEIVVRAALGASRARIILQLFAEALVLGAVAAVTGLVAAGFALHRVLWIVQQELFEEAVDLPFWITPRLSPTTILYATGLALLAAAIAGILPAVKVTKGLGPRLRHLSAGAGGLQFGGFWTVVIVGQIAVSIVFVAFSVLTVVRATQIRTFDTGFNAQEYLSVQLTMDQPITADSASRQAAEAEYFARFRASQKELARRLEAQPAVRGVTFATVVPGGYHSRRRIEVHGLALPPERNTGPLAQNTHVDADFFETFGAPIKSGRGFHSGDIENNARVVVVNQSFVHHLLGNRNPIGQRLRYIDSEDRGEASVEWYEIVGVIDDLAMTNDPELPNKAGIYHPLAADGGQRVITVVRVNGDAKAFAPRVRALATAIDPTIRLRNLMRMDEIQNTNLQVYGFWIRVLITVSIIALVLSLTGIYSVMAFTVARRTREIGIRVALGADRRRIVTSTLTRPIIQSGLGVLVGVGILIAMTGGIRSIKVAAMVLLFTVIMMSVCMLACIVPMRRAMRIQPTDALRAAD